jgi:hypothetical protein
MVEGLVKLVAKHRAAIISKWFDSAVQAYAPDTAAFLKSQKDDFANPVGSNTRKGLEVIFDQLLGDMDGDTITQYLDPIMRIRAVQNMPPSRATAFIFSLKAILRDQFSRELQESELQRQFTEIEGRIDRLGLTAFDLYMVCRDKINDLKANETRNRVFHAFERAGLVAKEPNQKN